MQLYTALLLSTLHCWNRILPALCAFIGFSSSGLSTCCEAKPVQLTGFVILWPFGLQAMMVSLQLLGSPLQVKKYGALFIWGQLSGWFKQTVYDPTASLSAERRGTLSLPDPDSSYTSLRQYTVKVGIAENLAMVHFKQPTESLLKIAQTYKNLASVQKRSCFTQVFTLSKPAMT